MKEENKHFGSSLVLVAAVVVVVLAIYMGVSAQLAGPGADMSPQAVAERIAPVASLNTGEPITPEAAAPAPAPATPVAEARTGEAVYNSACVACHATGAAGAPKIGDAAAWSPRIDKGMDALMQSAVNGLNAMPPRGTCAACSDEELRRAIEYMVEKSQ